MCPMLYKSYHSETENNPFEIKEDYLITVWSRSLSVFSRKKSDIGDIFMSSKYLEWVDLILSSVGQLQLRVGDFFP